VPNRRQPGAPAAITSTVDTAQEALLEAVREAWDHDASFPARFYPHAANQAEWIIRETPAPVTVDPEDGLPIPPVELFAGYGVELGPYVSVGRIHAQAMIEVLNRNGFTFGPGQRVLEFGCAAGRMIRCLRPYAEESEIWGVDIRAAHILWCQEHLSPPFRFVTTTTFPHLPFEDNTFDLIYAGSVFTHIADLSDMWLMELRRVLRPGGLLHVSIHDNRAVEVIMSSPPGDWLHDTEIRRGLLQFDARNSFTTTGYGMFTTSYAMGNAQVFHDVGFVRSRWGRYFEVLEITPEVYAYQAAVTLRKVKETLSAPTDRACRVAL
jgi:SAM-dependent methyltransferase